MAEYETIIGLEIHAQINTKTKLFCACDNDAFGKSPNTTVCPICMGHPGTLPVPNEVALKKSVKAGKALGCEISKDHHMDRKNYFYPDLPSGYQISQFQYPLSHDGCVEYGDGKKCGITRLHIENDAGKLVHEGGKSYCDYNRAGTPLMEIVTDPDLRNAQEAVEFVQELRRILITVDVSEADMYKGMMRFDASISLRPVGDEKLYPRAEIKNLNSFRSLEKALLFEEKRLRALWEAGTPPEIEVTVHWDDDKEEGVIMREKESAADYRYFPEPDIPPFQFDQEFVDSACGGEVELPAERRTRYEKWNLSEDEILMLINDPRLADYFDTICTHGVPEHVSVFDIKWAKQFVLTLLIGFLRSEGKELKDGPSSAQMLSLKQCVDNEITSNAAKDVLEKMVRTRKDPEIIIEEEGLQQISDAGAIEEVVKKAIAANPQAVEDYKNGKFKARAAIIGFVMKETKGQAEPQTVQDEVIRQLEL